MKGFIVGPIVGVPFDHGIVEEELRVVDTIKYLTSVCHGIGDGAAQEELAQDEVAASETVFYDLGVECFELGWRFWRFERGE